MSEAKPKSLLRRVFNLRTGVLLLVLVGVGALAALRLRPYLYMRGNFMPGVERQTIDESQSRLEENRAQQQREMAKAPEMLLPDAPSWPGYRGGDRSGFARDATGLLASWPEGGPPVLYKQPVGAGYAGFVIGSGRAFTIEQRRGQEVIACYDFETGIELWTLAYGARFQEAMGGEGPRATPALDGDRLYSLGAQGDLYCVNALTGEEIWHRDILKGMQNLQWGTACSPLILDDRVLVTSSGLGGDSVLALDKMTGEPIWSSLPEQQGYSSLVVAELAGRRQLLNFAAFALNALDPQTGEKLWSYPWTGPQNGINVAQPLAIGNDRVFISTGYGKGCALLQVTAKDGSFEVAPLWENLNMKNKFNPSIARDGHVYGLDEGVMVCVNLTDGERKWKAGRYGHGQVLMAGDQLYVLGEQGSLTLLAVDPEAHRVLGTAQPLEGKTWNTMAFAGGRLLIRNHKEMACLDLRAQTPS